MICTNCIYTIIIHKIGGVIKPERKNIQGNSICLSNFSYFHIRIIVKKVNAVILICTKIALTASVKCGMIYYNKNTKLQSEERHGHKK